MRTEREYKMGRNQRENACTRIRTRDQLIKSQLLQVGLGSRRLRPDIDDAVGCVGPLKFRQRFLADLCSP
jgi:hypothetical protein